jgi:TrmH family RNA methyltransferase
VLTKAALQRLRSLREKKHREELGLFVVEGEKVVGELLAAGFPFVELYATENWPAAATSRPVPGDDDPAHRGMRTPRLQPEVIRLSTAEMARASHFPTPSTVLAVGKIARAPLDPAALARGLTLALDGVQDPGNVGTLLRIADWFAFARVLLSPDCADRFHQKVINASMGSFARVSCHTADLPQVLAELSRAHPATPILGCDLAGTDVSTLPPCRDAVVIIGSEGRGLSTGVQKLVTQRVTIPRHGAAESLNAAVAAGIICHQLRRAP